MVSGTVWVESRLRIHPQVLIAAGLLAAMLAGLSAWLVSRPFLSAVAWELPLAGAFSLRVPSVLVFDVGVYLLVVGATVLMLVALAHQSLRSPRRTGAAAPLPATAVTGSAG
jgi:multicomponent K+:H+ antiporter subunit A